MLQNACTRTLQTPVYPPKHRLLSTIPAALYHVPAQRLLVLLFFTMVTSYPNGDGGVLLSVTVTELTSAVTVSKKRIRQSSPLTSWSVKWQVTRRDERLFIFHTHLPLMLSAGCQKVCCLLSRLTDSLSVSVALFFKKRGKKKTTAIHCWLWRLKCGMRSCYWSVLSAIRPWCHTVLLQCEP